METANNASGRWMTLALIAGKTLRAKGVDCYVWAVKDFVKWIGKP